MTKSWPRELLEDAVLIIIALAIVWGGGIGFQLYLGTPTPLLAVESHSMEPTLYRGDLVIVRGVDPATLSVGDIIIYDPDSLPGYQGDTPIVHRIIEIQNVSGELHFFTRGDNNFRADPEFRRPEDVMAKVIGSVRYLGFITLFLLTPGSFIYLLLTILLFVVSSFFCETTAPPDQDKEIEKAELHREDAPDSL